MATEAEDKAVRKIATEADDKTVRKAKKSAYKLPLTTIIAMMKKQGNAEMVERAAALELTDLMIEYGKKITQLAVRLAQYNKRKKVRLSDIKEVMKNFSKAV